MKIVPELRLDASTMMHFQVPHWVAETGPRGEPIPAYWREAELINGPSKTA
jgi:hypothetical protein